MEQRFTRITINGVTYASVEEMPPQVRKQYDQTLGRLMEDRDQNGVPDLFDKAGTNAMTVEQVTHQVFDANVQLGPKMQSSELPPVMHSMMLDGHGVRMGWPTLVALLATVAVIAGAIVLWVR